jgi:predicted glycosyltransferase involved in capsule biosynthesis
MKTTIHAALISHFHTLSSCGFSEPLQLVDYEDMNLVATVYHLRAIQRRVDGNNYLTPTDSNRALVKEEFMRVQWSTGKLPTIQNWYCMFICAVFVVFVSSVYYPVCTLP